MNTTIVMIVLQEDVYHCDALWWYDDYLIMLFGHKSSAIFLQIWMTLRTNTIDHLSEIHSDWGCSTECPCAQRWKILIGKCWSLGWWGATWSNWAYSSPTWGGSGGLWPGLRNRYICKRAILTSCSSFTQVERIQIRLIPIVIDHVTAEEGEQGAEE